MSYDSNNTGVLFKNSNKKSTTHPDYVGTITIAPDLAGKEISISAWLKESGPGSKKPGTKFMSLAVRAITPPPDYVQHSQQMNENAPFTDDIPF